MKKLNYFLHNENKKLGMTFFSGMEGKESMVLHQRMEGKPDNN